MNLSPERWGLPTLLLCLPLTGCPATGPKGEPVQGQITAELYEPPQQTLDLEEFELEWDDIELDAKGYKDPYDVARWTTERQNAAMRCLNVNPPARDQAIALLEEVMSRLPSSSKGAYLLGRCHMDLAAYWFRVSDRVVFELNRIAAEGTRTPGGVKLSPAEQAQLEGTLRAWLTRANAEVGRHGRQALARFGVYRQLRPDDKSLLDYMWKLHFYLQNYERSLQWLNYLLREMDEAEVQPEDLLRRDYEAIREQIRDYLATLRLEGIERPASGSGLLIPGLEKRRLHRAESGG